MARDEGDSPRRPVIGVVVLGLLLSGLFMVVVTVGSDGGEDSASDSGPGRLLYLTSDGQLIEADDRSASASAFAVPVAARAAEPTALAPSPDGDAVAFACDPASLRPNTDGHGLCTAAGDERARLWATALAPVRFPTWAADGSGLTYAALDARGHGSIWVTDGVAEPDTLCEDWCPLFSYAGLAWSPDLATVAAVAATPGGGGHPARIVLFDVATHNFEFLTDGRNTRGLQHNPSWSPDGDRLVFSSNADGRFDLWVAEVATGETQRITDEAGTALNPAWSPDGERIAFTSRIDGRWQLLEVSPDGGPTETVVADGNPTRARYVTSNALTSGPVES